MMWFPCFQMLPGQCTSSTAECRLDDSHNTDALARGLGPAYNGRIEHDWWRCDPTPTIQSMHKLWSIFFPNPKHVATPKYVTNLAMPRLCEGKSASLFGWIRLHVMLMEDEHGYIWHCNHCGNETGILYEFNDLHVGKTWKGWDKLGKSWGKLCRVLTKRLVGRLERGKIGRSSPSHPQVLQYSPNLPQLFIQIFPTSSPKVFWKSSGSLPPTFL